MPTSETLLPQNRDQLFLTDGGIETTLIFHEGFDLPYFAAFDLLKSQKGRVALKKYYEPYATLAVHSHVGFILESPTWRANSDWATKIGYNDEELAHANREAINLLREIREEFTTPDSPFLISGCLGPRGDGYQVEDCMNSSQAYNYHIPQVNTFAKAGADMITAITMTYPNEAIGIAMAAKANDIHSVISFTTETDGRLPDGTSLEDAINQVDEETQNAPSYYMINCAHPDHFRQALDENKGWVKRIHGVRANASRKSHAELDEAEELDIGDPQELGQLYHDLRERFPQFNVLGGCCGTDYRHIGEICHSCMH